MSLTEVLDAIRILSPDEQAEVREFLLADLRGDSRIDRFEKLRGSAKDVRFGSMTLEDFETERREGWKAKALAE